MTHIEQGLSSRQIDELTSSPGQRVTLILSDQVITGTIVSVDANSPSTVLNLIGMKIFKKTGERLRVEEAGQVPLKQVCQYEIDLDPKVPDEGHWGF